MLKREITYTFFDDEGQEVTETEVFWFHLASQEINEWNAKYKEGIGKTVEKMLRQDDREGLFSFFKKLLLDSYGIREEGGRRFVKSPELRKQFEDHAAYEALYIELATNEDKAAEFFNGIFPKNLPQQDKPVVDVVSTVKSP